MAPVYANKVDAATAAASQRLGHQHHRLGLAALYPLPQGAMGYHAATAADGHRTRHLAVAAEDLVEQNLVVEDHTVGAVHQPSQPTLYITEIAVKVLTILRLDTIEALL